MPDQPEPAAPDPDGSPVVEATDDFLIFLATRAGKSAAELSKAWREVLAAVHATGKNGSLTYTVKFKVNKDLPGRAVVPEDSISTTVPQPDRDPMGLLLWVTKDGELLDSPENQTQLPIDTRHGGTR